MEGRLDMIRTLMNVLNSIETNSFTVYNVDSSEYQPIFTVSRSNSTHYVLEHMRLRRQLGPRIRRSFKLDSPC